MPHQHSDKFASVSVSYKLSVMGRLGFGVRGLAFRVRGAGFRVRGAGFRVRGVGFRVRGFGFRVRGLGNSGPQSNGYYRHLC